MSSTPPFLPAAEETRWPFSDDPITVVPYDAGWPAAFQAERQRIWAAIDPAGAVIEHIGSTSVPGLAAKPVLDILIGVERLEAGPRWIAALQALGYEYIAAFEDALPNRRYFRRFQGTLRTHQIHLVERGSHDWSRHLAFRDFLRAHPARAEAYGRLKLELAARCADDREVYMDGKDAFVQALESEALRWAGSLERPPEA